MGHRLTAALAFLNAMALFACIILIAAAISKDPEIAVAITRAIQYSVQMFVVGAALPTVAWGISAFEMNRTNAKVRVIESWVIYVLLLASLLLFIVAATRLPNSIIASLG